MNYIDNHLPTEKLQALDAAHHIHPFSDMGELNAKGTRVITRLMGHIFGTATATSCWTAWPVFGA